MAAFGMGRTLLARLFDQGGVTGVFCEGDRSAGEDAEGESGTRSEGQANGCGDTGGTKRGQAGALASWFCVDRGEQAKKKKQGDPAIKKANNRKPDMAAVGGC